MAKKKPTEPTGLASQAQLDIKSSWDYVANTYVKIWDDAWKLYNNERININYQGVANSFDPMAYNIVETTVSNVFGTKPRIVYLPTQIEQTKETRVLNQMYNYTWDKSNMSYHIIPFGRSLSVTGNATIWHEWDPETNWVKMSTRAVRDCIFDPNARNPWEMRYGGYRYLTTIDEAKDVKMMDDQGNWVAKYQELDSMPRWTNGANPDIDKEVKDCYTGSFVDGNAKKEQFEISVLYYLRGPWAGKVIEMGNRSVVLYVGDSPYQKPAQEKTVKVAQYGDDGQPQKDSEGKPVLKSQSVTIPEIKPFIPVAFQRNNTDESLLYGKGDIEPIADLQEQLNDTINLKRDNFTFNINNMWTVDPQYKDMIKKIKNVPNSVYAIPPDAIKPLQKEDMTQSADVEIARIKESIRETAAQDEIVNGMEPTTRTTATQINQQLNQAGQRFSIKLQLLENEAYKQSADIVYKLFQIFVTTEMVVRITGRRGVDFLKLDPNLYWGTYEPMVQLEQNAKAQVQDEIKRIQAVGQILLNNPYVDQKELTRVIAQRVLEFDDDEADTILVKDEDLQPKAAPGPAPQAPGLPPMAGQLPQGMPQGAPQGPQLPTMPNGQFAANPTAMASLMPQADDSNAGPRSVQDRIIESIDFADLSEDAKQQMLAQIGIFSRMPSPQQQQVILEAHKVAQSSQKMVADAHIKALSEAHKVVNTSHQHDQNNAKLLLAAQQQANTQAVQAQQMQQSEAQPEEAPVA